MYDHANADAAETERYLRSMFDAMFEGVQILDAEWRYVYLNRTAASHGRRTRKELLGRSMRETYPGIEETEMFGLLEHCMAVREPGQMINRFDYPDGEAAWFDLRVYPTPEGGLLILSVDVTAQRTADEMLHQAQKMEAVGRLAAGVAHDFNNVLSVITSYTDVVLKRLPEEDRLRGPMREIKRASEHAATLTRQLLDFSRKRAADPEVVDASQLIGSLGPMLRRLLGADIELVTRLAPAPTPVLFDSGRLHQVLMNLAVNARDAMPDGGRLVLETALIEADDRDAAALHALPALPTPGGGAVLIAVTDTGTGMDEATRARIFEPFFTTKEPGLGTGLGLATTHSIVAEAGGRIVVESEPGLGTAFRIYLPRAEAAAAVEDAAIGPSPQSHDGRTVLVVEDEPAVRGVIRTVLEEAGYSVVEAGSGDSAMDALRSTDPGIHLLLTDIVLPGSSGRDVARSAVEARPDLPVVFMSGYRDSVLGPDSWFLEKPFTADALLDVVARALG